LEKRTKQQKKKRKESKKLVIWKKVLFEGIVVQCILKI